jgi:hypothetical protein
VKKIIYESDIKNLMENISYMDIHRSIEKQKNAIKAWKKVFKVWTIKLEGSKLSPSGHQVHVSAGHSALYTLNARAAQTVDTGSPDDSTNTVYDFG